MRSSICILAVTLLDGYQPAQAAGRSHWATISEAAHPTIAAGRSGTGEISAPPFRASPFPKPPASRNQVPSPTEPDQEANPAGQKEPATSPPDGEDVKPGEAPDSCEGCELAGSLWGLLFLSRRKGIPRPQIRGHAIW